jgi:hypothetical protein
MSGRVADGDAVATGARDDSMKRFAVPALAVLTLSACATVPLGPSVMVLPGTGKPLEQFQVDDAACRQWAFHQSGAAGTRTAGESAAGGAAIGTLLGAAAGAAIGAAAGSAGTGAAIGAGAGLIGGSAIGASAGDSSSWVIQRRYDIAYQQCMYAKGNQIPGIVRTGGAVYVPPPPPPPPAAGQRVPTPPGSAGTPPPNTPPPPSVAPAPPR